MTLTVKQELLLTLTEIEDDILSATLLAEEDADLYDWSLVLGKVNMTIADIIEKLGA